MSNWNITADLWARIAELMDSRYCHALGDRGAVFYCHKLGGSFVLTDNGGEVNVSGLNRVIDLPSIPTTDANCDLLDAGTIAYRIFAKMTGQAVDYSRVVALA